MEARSYKFILVLGFRLTYTNDAFPDRVVYHEGVYVEM